MEKLPKNIYNVQYRFSPFLFRSYLLSNLELPSSIHTLKWNHFCLHFLFWFWLTLVNTDCGDYNFVVVVVPFMPVKADQVLGLTEGKDPVASHNLGINKEECCFYIPLAYRTPLLIRAPFWKIHRKNLAISPFFLEQTFEKFNRMPPWKFVFIIELPEIGTLKIEH